MNQLVRLSSKQIAFLPKQHLVQMEEVFRRWKGDAKDTKAKAPAKSSEPKQKSAKKGDKGEAANTEKQIKSLLKQYYLMKSYEAPKLDTAKQEEYAVIAKEYSRRITKMHHEAERRLNDKIFLRDLAISALPTEEMRAFARQTDTEQIPGKFFYPAKKARFEDLSKELAW